MNNESHRLLLEQAATVSMEHIRRDGDRAPERLKKLFHYLEQHLFNRGLDVTRMKIDCDMHDNSLSIFFAEATGLTPHNYITQRRVETAAALLRDTNLRIRLISQLIGFSRQGILTLNFKACYGMTPRAFRQGVKNIFARAGGRPGADMPSTVELRTALAAGAESREATALISRIRYYKAREGMLRTAATTQEPQETSNFEIFSFAKGHLEEIKVEVVWEMLKEKPWAVQRDMIRKRLTFSTPAFFHLLRENSIPEGRDNRKFGVHLAELALDCLTVTEQVIGTELFELRSQGWTWAGNARRLAVDLKGAEAAFSIAATYLGHQEQESLVTAEFYGMKSALRRWQRRLAEAFQLHARALSIFRAMGTPKDVAASLIDGARTHDLAGNAEESVMLLTEAIHVTRNEATHFLNFLACFYLTNAYLQTGNLDKAKELLQKTRSLRDFADNSEVILYHLQWLEGRVSDAFGELTAASDRYQIAQHGFLKLGHNIHFSLVSLDIALLRLKQDRVGEVQGLTLPAIPAFEGIELHDEAAAAWNLLKCATEKGELTRGLLEGARKHLDEFRMERWR